MRKANKLMKKTVKGMTLMECIIAILVLGIMGTIAARIAQISCTVMMDTNHLENKTNAEAPHGAVRDVSIEDTVAYPDFDSSHKQNIQISVNSYGTVDATEYSAEAAAKAASGNTNSNMNAHLHYYVLTQTPEATHP